MSNEYNRLVGYILHIIRSGQSTPERVIVQRRQGLVLPISQKKYKLTLRNLKIYLNEMKQYDPTIKEICVDKICRVGIIEWND